MLAERMYQIAILLLTALILFFSSALVTTKLILKGEIVTVPDLRGKTPEEGRAELSRHLLSFTLQGTQFHDQIEKGRIISQDPPAGSKVKANRTVKVILSAGSEMVDVPDLVGKSLESAVQTLASLGLSRGLISQIHTPEYPAGRVIAQDPAPTTGKVKRNTPVQLLISQGEREEKYVMPDLIGLRASRVIPQLKALGFNVANVRTAYYPGLDAGIIIKQMPAHGFCVQKRNLISLEVSK